MRKSSLAVVGAVMVATGASAGGKGDGVPPGWTVVADSSTQLTLTSGENGWSCWFTTDTELNPQPMQPSTFVKTPSGFDFTTWSPAPTVGCSSGLTVCLVQRQVNLTTNESGNVMHGNTSSCCTSAAGRQDPILRWVSPTVMNARVELFGVFAVGGGGEQSVQLSFDGVPTLLAGDALFGASGATVNFDVENLDTLELQLSACTPFDFRMRVFAPDCNGNFIADAVEISTGTDTDYNADGIPDSCECLHDVIENGIIDGADLAALLSVWGTDGGIYPRADVNADGTVNAADLAAVLSGWGACP